MDRNNKTIKKNKKTVNPKFRTITPGKCEFGENTQGTPTILSVL